LQPFGRHSSRVKSSEEIRRIIDRWMTAQSEGDADSVLERLSEHPGALAVGTDAAEWWRGATIRALWRRQIDELADVWDVEADEIEAWEEGSVGWGSVRQTVRVEGRTFECRATCVFHLERGEWKVVQLHLSFPQANTETFGMSLTATLDELDRMVQRDQP